MIHDLKSRASSAKKKHKNLLRKMGSGSGADKLMREIHDEVFDKTDCLSCANCCKTTGPLFTPKDIDRISGVLKVKPGEFIDMYLKKDEDNDLVLQVLPCPFLESDNKCRIYENRPRACREYPHTSQKGQAAIVNLTLKNATICPAVFNILEKIESRLK